MLNFSGISSTSRLGRLLRWPLRLVPWGAELFVLQGPLRGARWIAGSTNHGCWLGTYEKEKQLSFWKTLRPGGVVYDIGASVGFYTLLGARGVGPDGRVYAFEPLTGNLEYLRRHLALNRATNVEIIEAAVSDVSGERCFDPGPNSSMGHLSAWGSVRVISCTLDQLFAEGRIRPPTCVKIDVEGAEAAVIRGARQVLRTWRPPLLIATHGAEVHRETVTELTLLGYTVEDLYGNNLDETDELICR